MSWLLAFLGFALLIILHEAGHFVAAKAVGMRVERFALFFPPLIARRKRGETEYAIDPAPTAAVADLPRPKSVTSPRPPLRNRR